MDFDHTLDTGHGDTFSVRMMYVHLIGEYARHNGHADLIREASTGSPGAERPGPGQPGRSAAVRVAGDPGQ